MVSHDVRVISGTQRTGVEMCWWVCSCAAKSGKRTADKNGWKAITMDANRHAESEARRPPPLPGIQGSVYLTSHPNGNSWVWECDCRKVGASFSTSELASAALKKHLFNMHPLHEDRQAPSEHDVRAAITSIEETIRGHTEPTQRDPASAGS